MFPPYYQAYRSLKPFAVELDMEKYYDIYEISRNDMEDAEALANQEISEIGSVCTLRDLKIGLHNLHIVRKLFLCTLLALNADGSNTDFHRWSSATETMTAVISITTKMTTSIDEIMGEEEGETAGRSQCSIGSQRMT